MPRQICVTRLCNCLLFYLLLKKKINFVIQNFSGCFDTSESMVPRLVPEILSLDAFCDTGAAVGIGDSRSWIRNIIKTNIGLYSNKEQKNVCIKNDTCIWIIKFVSLSAKVRFWYRFPEPVSCTFEEQEIQVRATYLHNLIFPPGMPQSWIWYIKVQSRRFTGNQMSPPMTSQPVLKKISADLIEGQPRAARRK